MKRLYLVLLLGFSMPLFSMDVVELAIPESVRTSEDEDGLPSLTKQITPETLFFEYKDKDNRFITIGNFMNALGFNQPGANFNTDTIIKAIEKVPVEKFNKLVGKYSKVFSAHLDIQNNTTQTQLTSHDIQHIRERIFHEFLIAHQQENEVLNNKYIGRREQYEQSMHHIAKMQRRFKVQCCLFFGLPITIGWAITTTALLFLKSNC